MRQQNNIFKEFVSNLRTVLSMLEAQKTKIFVMIVLSILSMIIGICIPYLWGNITNGLFYGLQDSIAGINNIEGETIIKLILVLTGFYLINFLFNIIEGLISTKVATNITYKLRKQIINKINHLPISFVEKQETGEILSRIVNDVETVGTTSTTLFVKLITSTSLLFSSIVMMFIIQSKLTLIVLLLIPIGYIFMRLIVRYSQGHYIKKTEQLGAIDAFIEETISGLSVVNVFNKRESFMKKFKDINNNLYKESILTVIISTLIDPIMVIVNNLSYISSIILGTYLCTLQILKIGDIIAFVQYLSKVQEPINSIISLFNSVQSMAASIRRIEEYLSLKDEDDIKDSGEILTTNIHNYKSPILSFKDISFSYDGKNNVINNFNLNIYKGQTVAIVGPTGSGKTTIIKLLLKFYDNYSGEIFIGNKNIKDVSKKTIRNECAIVLQKVWVFFGTISENIKYGKLDATNKEVTSVAKLSKADDFIVKLRDKYEHIISERGDNLSNGQKQLIAISRALIAEKEIIILDEATSSVDSKTEEMIYEAFDNTIKNKTSIVIAHRLSTIQNADKIIVVNHGKIEEQGTHEQLINKHGFYSELFNSGLSKHSNN